MARIMKTKKISLISVMVCAATLTLAACGSSSTASDSTSAPSETTAAPETTPPTIEDTSTTSVAATTQTTTELNIAGGNDPEDYLMPNVVCMTLQEAQDEIQDHGVFYSKSEDATGKNRGQWVDSNWIVVKQSPAPGTKIGEGEAVLSAVKIGESTGGVCK